MTLDQLKQSCRTVYGAQTEVEFGDRLAAVLMVIAADPLEPLLLREVVQLIQGIRDKWDRTHKTVQRMTFSTPLTQYTQANSAVSPTVPLLQSALSPEQFNEYTRNIGVK